MLVQDRQTARQFFVETWRKYRSRAVLEPLEDLVAQVILWHPEYHSLLEKGEDIVHCPYLPEMEESNPFLHMGLHIAVREQLLTDRPPGIMSIHRGLLRRFDDPHELEHRMMECLAEALWAAQQKNELPNEQVYLECLRRISEGEG